VKKDDGESILKRERSAYGRTLSIPRGVNHIQGEPQEGAATTGVLEDVKPAPSRRNDCSKSVVRTGKAGAQRKASLRGVRTRGEEKTMSRKGGIETQEKGGE